MKFELSDIRIGISAIEEKCHIGVLQKNNPGIWKYHREVHDDFIKSVIDCWAGKKQTVISETGDKQYEISVHILKNDSKITGLSLIKQERSEQINKHGWSLEQDQQYLEGQLIQAALFCIEQYKNVHDTRRICYWPDNWDEYFEFKIRRKNAIGKLSVAGAFYMAEHDRSRVNYDLEINMIAAEIDRLLVTE